MQEVALKHATLLGFGFDDMIKNNMLWVLTRMGLKITKPMKWDQSVKVKTWSRGIDGAFSFREFIFFDENNAELGRASSSFVPIDLVTRKPTAIFDASKINSVAINQKVDLILEKIVIPENLEIGLNHKVRNTDLDINNHANNAKYVEWIYNTLPIDFLKNKDNYFFQINYLGEANLLDQVEIKRSPIENNWEHFYFEGRNLETNKKFFTAKLSL